MKNNFSWKNFLNKQVIFFYLVSIIFIICWFALDTSKTVKVISAVLFLVGMYQYNKLESHELIIRVINWILFTFILVISLVYISVSLGEPNLALTFLLVLVGLTLGVFIFIIMTGILFTTVMLYKSEDIWKILLCYVGASFLIILFFGSVYVAFGNSENGLVWSGEKEESVSSVANFMYFSSSAYFSNGLGDIIPKGYSKLIFQFQVFISYLLHLIILGAALSKLNAGKISQCNFQK